MIPDRFVAPRTPVEEQLASIWRDVLRLEQVGVHDNYFELGRDSIQSTLVISAARKIGIRLTPKQLFEYPTIAELALVAIHDADSIAIEQGSIEGDCPLTPIQHWFFEQQLADPEIYNKLPPAELDEMMRQAGKIRRQRETAEQRWLEASEALEQLQA